MLDWLYRRMARAGLRGLMRGKQQAENNVGRATLNASWETVLGEILRPKGDLWGSQNAAQREETYSQNAMVYACVREITSSFNQAPLEAGRLNEDGEWEPEWPHPITDLLANPNNWMSGAELSERRVASLLLTGKSYLWEWRAPTGDAAELWPIPASWVKNVPLKELSQKDDRRVLSHYEVQVPGARQGRALSVPLNDMVYDRMLDPSSLSEGIGPLEACYRDYKLEVERTNYMIEMLNAIRPGLVIRQPEEFEPGQKDELRAVLKETVGKGSRGGALFLYGEGAGVDVIAPLKDLDWPGMSNLDESHICAAFGVPPLIVHARVAQENSPLSSPNLDAAYRVFFQGTMTSLWLHDADSLTLGLLRNERRWAGEPDLELRYDTSNVSALQEDQEKVNKRVETASKAGVISASEARSLLGLPDDPAWEGIAIRPMSMVDVRIGGGEEEIPAPGQEETFET